MRRSQITLVAALGAVALAIVVLVALARVALSSFAADPGNREAPAADADFAVLSEDLTGFDRVLIRDSWEVDIRQGDTWGVELTVAQDRARDLRVGVADGRLVLDDARRRGWRWAWFGSDERHRAEIVMPALEGIEIEGSADVRLAGFDGAGLAVTGSGAVNIEGRDGRFESLSLVMSGASNANFSRVPVVDAHLELSGASNVMLAMAGGRLTGTLSGFGNVLYTGRVREESVNVSGFGRVGPADQN